MKKPRTEAQEAWLTLYFNSMGCRIEGDEIIDLENGERVATLRKVKWDKNGKGAQVEITAHSSFSCVNALVRF